MKIIGSIILLCLAALAFAGFFSTKEINTHIEIEGTPAEVWDALTRFDQYQTWNPFITHITGHAIADSRISATIRAPIIREMDFFLTVDNLRTDQEMVWLGETLLPNVLDGYHYFHIKQIDENRVKFSQGERFKGLLLFMSWPFMSGMVEKNFTDMNIALKQYVENME